MADKQLKLEITAEATSLFDALGRSSDGIQRWAVEAVAKVGGITDALEGLQRKVLAVAAAWGLKTKLQETAQATVDWTVQAERLSRSLGTTSEQSSVLAVAVRRIHGDVDEFLAGAGKLVKTLNANEQAIRNLGVETRDANGHFRAAPDLIADINAKLGQYRQGIDRDLAAQQVYGRSWQEMLRFVKLTPEVMAEAREEADRLHLTVGEGGKRQVEAYRRAVQEADDTLLGLKLSLGAELLPTLTRSAAWIAENGPGFFEPLTRGLGLLLDLAGNSGVQVGVLSAVFLHVLWPALAQAGVGVLALAQTIRLQANLAMMEGYGAVRAYGASILGALGPVNAFALGLGALVFLASRWLNAASRAAEETRRLASETLSGSQRFESLSREAERLDGVMRSSQASAEDKRRAQERLATVLGQLNTLYPGFNRFLQDEAGHHRSIAEALRLANAERQKSIDLQVAQVEAQLREQEQAFAKWTAAAATSFGGTVEGGAIGRWLFGKKADSAAEALQTTRKALADLLDAKRALQGEAGALEGGGLRAEGKGDSESRLARLKADLEREKYLYERAALDRGQFAEFSKTQEAAWLEENTAKYGLNAKERQSVELEVFKLKREVLKQGHDAEVQALKTAQEAAKDDGAQRIRLAEEVAEKVRARYGAESKEAQAAAGEVLKVRREVAREEVRLQETALERVKAHQVALLDLEAVGIRHRRETGAAGEAETLVALQALETRRVAIEAKALRDRLALAALEPQERAKVEAELEALADRRAQSEEAFRLKLADLAATGDGAAGWARGFEEAGRRVADVFGYMRERAGQAVDGIENSLAQGFSGILSRTSTLSEGLRSMWQGVAQTAVQAISQMLARMLVLNAMELLTARTKATAEATKAAAVLRTSAANAASIGTTTAKAAADTAATAPAVTSAAAQTFQTHASIPIVGAIIAAALVAVMLASMASVKATGRAVGGLVTRPELTLLGEAGPELVAPESDFRSYTRDVLQVGATLERNLARERQAARAYQAQGSAYAQDALSARRGAEEGGRVGAPGHAVDLRGAVIAGESAESGRILGDLIHRHLDDHARRNA